MPATEKIDLRLEPEDRQRLEHLADAMGGSKAEVVRVALRELAERRDADRYAAERARLADLVHAFIEPGQRARLAWEFADSGQPILRDGCVRYFLVDGELGSVTIRDGRAEFLLPDPDGGESVFAAPTDALAQFGDVGRIAQRHVEAEAG